MGESRAQEGQKYKVSLEYAGPAGWIGLGLSEAARNPQFGRKEAVIGIPGIGKAAAVRAEEGGSGPGQQIFAREGGPAFTNPGKYEIPAGGIEKGFSGPSLKLLRGVDRQTLRHGSVSAINAYLDPNGVVSEFIVTKMSFEKFLWEPDEIEVDPNASTLLLYAAAPVDSSGAYDGNPEWKHTYLTFLDGPPDVLKEESVRKRTRKHRSNE